MCVASVSLVNIAEGNYLLSNRPFNLNKMIQKIKFVVTAASFNQRIYNLFLREKCPANNWVWLLVHRAD